MIIAIEHACMIVPSISIDATFYLMALSVFAGLGLSMCNVSGHRPCESRVYDANGMRVQAQDVKHAGRTGYA